MAAGSKFAEALVAEARENFFCALVLDVLDGLDCATQALPSRIRPGDVAVCACGGTGRIASWGGLPSTAAKLRGAKGGRNGWIGQGH